MNLEQYRKLSREERREFRRSENARRRESWDLCFEEMFARYWMKAEPQVEIRSVAQMKEYATKRLICTLDPNRIGDLETDVLRQELIVVVEHIISCTDHSLTSDDQELVIEHVVDKSVGQGISKLKARCRATPEYVATTKCRARLGIAARIVWPIGVAMFWLLQPMMIFVIVMNELLDRVFCKEDRNQDQGLFDEYLRIYLGLERVNSGRSSWTSPR